MYGMLVTACFIQASIDILFHIDINICLKTRFLFHEIHISYRMLILRNLLINATKSSQMQNQ